MDTERETEIDGYRDRDRDRWIQPDGYSQIEIDGYTNTDRQIHR